MVAEVLLQRCPIAQVLWAQACCVMTQAVMGSSWQARPDCCSPRHFIHDLESTIDYGLPERYRRIALAG